MNLSTIDLNLLVALDLLLEHRSVRGAARAAGVTPSAMSHTLGRLRALLEDDLLVRAGAGLVMTPRAEALVVPVREALDGVRRALAPPAHFDPTRCASAFRVVCTDHVSTLLLPRVAAVLGAVAPLAALHERPLLPTLMEELRAGEVDVAVGVFPEAPPEMRGRRLFSDSFVTVCRPDHPRLAGETLTLERFLAEGHMLVAPRGTPVGTIDALLSARGLTRRIVRTVPNFLSALWQVGQGDLLLTVSQRLVSEVAGWLPLRALPTPLPVPTYTLMAVWHPRVDSAAEHVWFRGLLSSAGADLSKG